MSAGQIAELVGRSKTTVRHWLREFGLKTQWTSRRAASAEGRERLQLRCPQHGLTPFGLRKSGGYRCNRCRADAVSRRRRKVKLVLVEDAGGACKLCGYDRCMAALEFHHLVPTEKRFGLSHRGVARSSAAARAEAARCVLLCANCHAEVEAGLATVG
jgi:5-methylcytosine-specific restriction endonuclease McrA